MYDTTYNAIMNPINRVSVVSTGLVRIRPQHAEANGSPLAWWLFTSRRWTAPLPINVYVIEHERGLVLFDTGQDRRSVTDSDYFPRGLARLIFRRLARFSIDPEQTLAAQLERIGYTLADVKVAVLSHLHQDHIGGIPGLGGAELVVSEAEWALAQRKNAETNGFLIKHIDLPGLTWRRINSDIDLFGDGSIEVISTPGHTPGSISMLVRRPGMPPLLFVGDLTYDLGLLARRRVPGVGDRKQLLESYDRVEQLQRENPGLVILAAHDPAAAGLLAAAVSGVLL
jgi:N-acyl homoserine lactone hydrolase